MGNQVESGKSFEYIADKGWQFSFRIHNASAKVEPSLKFDINLEGNPHDLFTHHVFI